MLLAAAPGVWAGAPTDALRDLFGAVNVVLTDPATEQQPFERLRLIRRHVNAAFDFREAAKLSLGREWTARTPTEQNEFVAIFADLLERSFVWRVAGKASLGGGMKVRYRNERVTGDTATVDTELMGRDGNEIQLDYRLIHRSARRDYPAPVKRGVRATSYAELASQLRAKLGMASVGAQVTPIPIAAAAPPPPAVMPFGPRETARPIDVDRQAIARDVAAVVTPSLVVSDVAPSPRAPLATPALAEPPRSTATPPSAAPAPSSVWAAAAPPPVGPQPIASDSSSVRIQSNPGAVTPAPTVVSPAPPAPAVLAPPAPAPAAPAPMTSPVLARPTEATPALATPDPTPAALATPVKVPAPGVNGGTPLASPSGSGFWVQVGAFRDTTMAGRVAKAVNGEILVVADASLGGARIGESPLLRVRVGPFVERTQAVSRARDLQALGYKPFIAAGD
jgi:hypothetical protein